MKVNNNKNPKMMIGTKFPNINPKIKETTKKTEMVTETDPDNSITTEDTITTTKVEIEIITPEVVIDPETTTEDPETTTPEVVIDPETTNLNTLKKKKKLNNNNKNE